MDNIIDELIQEYKLTDYEALVVTGIVGILAVDESMDLKEIYKRIDKKLKPIVNKIIDK